MLEKVYEMKKEVHDFANTKELIRLNEKLISNLPNGTNVRLSNDILFIQYPEERKINLEEYNILDPIIKDWLDLIHSETIPTNLLYEIMPLNHQTLLLKI